MLMIDSHLSRHPCPIPGSPKHHLVLIAPILVILVRDDCGLKVTPQGGDVLKVTADCDDSFEVAVQEGHVGDDLLEALVAIMTRERALYFIFFVGMVY